MTTTRPDPADSAIEALAAARWMREPDWPSMKEKLMQAPRSRSRRPFLVAALITGFAAAAAAGVAVYESYRFTGVMHLSDGSTAAVSGEIRKDGEHATITVDTEIPNPGAAGEMEITLENGQKARIIAVPAGEPQIKVFSQPQPK